MRNALHDEIDETEKLLSESDEIVEKTIRTKLIEYLDDASRSDPDASEVSALFRAALTRVAVDVAEEAASLTTRAVVKGAKAAKRRAEIR